jgi:hypothetical protein
MNIIRSLMFPDFRQSITSAGGSPGSSVCPHVKSRFEDDEYEALVEW